MTIREGINQKREFSPTKRVVFTEIKHLSGIILQVTKVTISDYFCKLKDISNRDFWLDTAIINGSLPWLHVLFIMIFWNSHLPSGIPMRSRLTESQKSAELEGTRSGSQNCNHWPQMRGLNQSRHGEHLRPLVSFPTLPGRISSSFSTPCFRNSGSSTGTSKSGDWKNLCRSS